MVKVFALIPARPDITQDYFHEHWAGIHAEHAQRITILERYVQSHRVDPDVSGIPNSRYEGIAEVWMTDVATAASMGTDPNYTQYAQLDEPNFIDMEHLSFVMTNETVVRSDGKVSKDDGGVKAMLLLRAAPGVSGDQLAERLGPRLEELLPDALRISLAVAVPESYADGAEPTFDLVVELRFAGSDEFVAGWDSARDAVLAELEGVADLSQSYSFLAEENRVIWPADLTAVA